MATQITFRGLGEIAAKLTTCREELPHAVNYALAKAADEIRDKARANVPGSPYNLSHDMWALNARMSKKHLYTSEIGYFTKKEDGMWHIKFYEKGASRRRRGSIVGQHFLHNAANGGEALAIRWMNESIEFMLRKVGLT